MWRRNGVSDGQLPYRTAASGPLVNLSTGDVVATDVTVAADRTTRRRGLLGRDYLSANAAFVLVPCFAIHTWGMRFPIDLLFVDATGRVIKACERVPGRRMAAALGGHAVVELAAGRIAATGTRTGDKLGRLKLQYGRVDPGG